MAYLSSTTVRHPLEECIAMLIGVVGQEQGFQGGAAPSNHESYVRTISFDLRLLNSA